MMPFPISNTPDFTQEIEKIRDSLHQLKTINNTDALVKFENQLTLNELENCLVSSSDPEELGENLKEFLANRWERIRNSFASYTQQPTNKVNLLCLELANILSPLPLDPADYNELELGKGPYFLLMPSLTVHETLSYENIHHLKLHEFILSDNGELYIPIISCLEHAYTSETGEMSHLMMDPNSNALFPPLLTSTELARVAEHSREVNEYYQLIQEYNQKRLHDSNLGNELNKLAQALRAGGAHAGGQEYDSGADSNIGTLKFVEFWRDYPEEKKKWALAHYKNPSLEEALGRLMRPADTNYLDTTYCVEIIARDFISPLVEQIQNEEGELNSLKEQIIVQKAVAEVEMKKPDYPAFLNLNLGTGKQPQVLRQIFALKEEQQKEIFAHTRSKSALLYALKYEPLALPQFFDLLDETAKEQMISTHFSNNDTALIIAARAGGKESVELLLGLGADVNAQDHTHETALHWAAAKGHNGVVELLLEKGAMIDCKGAKENTPLHCAVIGGHAAVVATLLERGADVTAKNRQISSSSFWGGLTYPHQNAFDLAIEHHPELIEPLLFKAITLSSKEQQSCLHNVEYGIYDNVLIYAAARHPLLLDDLVAELKKQPSDIIQPILSSENDRGKTPLMLAASLGRIKATQDLLEIGADLEARDDNQKTVLHEAASNAHADVVELLLNKATLLDKKAALLESKDDEGNTPLHFAASNGGRVVTVLLEQGADLNARNRDNENALDIARGKQDFKLMEPLLVKANTLPPEQQRLCLSRIQGGAYSSVMLYAMCEQPNVVNELLITNGKMEQCLAGHKAMDKFIDIDVHIATFNEKLKEMERKEIKNHVYEPAVRTIKTLIRELKIAKAEFILAEDMSMEDKKAVFKQKCLDAAQDARPVLEQHRELGKLIASFILIILTLPISLPLLALGIFSLKTNSVQQLDLFKEDLDDLRTSNNRNLMSQA